MRNSSLGECYGKADRPLELLAGNRLLGHRRDLEDTECLRVVDANDRHTGTYHLVFVVLPRQYLVFWHDRCLGVLCLAQFAEALKLKAFKGRSTGQNKRRKCEAIKPAADKAMEGVTEIVRPNVRRFPREG